MLSTHLLLLLLGFLSILLPDKETKKVTRRVSNPDLKEICHVLRSDESVKHGSYILESQGHVLIEGHYNMGIKDSIWTQYNFKNKMRARGRIIDNKRAGLWEFFNYLGELEQRVDFSANKVLYYQSAFTDYPFVIFTGSDTLVGKLDRPPLYVGGTSRFKEYVAEEIHIPLHKQNEKVSGTVYVRFTIDSTGRTSDHHLLKGIHRACNDEALRVIKNIPDDWLPGILNGKPVCVQYILPIIFDEKLSLPDYLYWHLQILSN